MSVAEQISFSGMLIHPPLVDAILMLTFNLVRTMQCYIFPLSQHSAFNVQPEPCHRPKSQNPGPCLCIYSNYVNLLPLQRLKYFHYASYHWLESLFSSVSFWTIRGRVSKHGPITITGHRFKHSKLCLFPSLHLLIFHSQSRWSEVF